MNDSSVADPKCIDMDPDPTFYINADLVSTFTKLNKIKKHKFYLFYFHIKILTFKRTF